MYDPFANYDAWKTAAPDEDFDDGPQPWQVPFENQVVSTEPGQVAHLKDLFIKAFWGNLEDCPTEEDAKAWITRRIYKDNDCGPWIKFNEDGVEIGSIVEGSDVDITSDPLTYPFTFEELDATINQVELDAEVEWEWANELEEDEFGNDGFFDPYLDF